jgi:uncharacterized Zn-binding protein involved in type VI secretion
MSGRPAARITDNVVHPLPPVLTPGPGSFNTLIGYLPAWRGVPAAAAAAIQAAKQASDIVLQAAQAATLAAAGTPGAPAAKAAEEATKVQQAAQMSATITSAAGGADIHMCTTPVPVPPHGPGVVIDGSPTVLINNLPACRMGDTIIEAIGPPNKIAKGEFTVLIGNSGSGCSISGGGGGGAGAPSNPQGASGGPGSGGSSSPSSNTGSSSPGAGSGGGSSGGPRGGGSPPPGGSSTLPPLQTQVAQAQKYSGSPAGPAIRALAEAAAKGAGIIEVSAGVCQALPRAASSSTSSEQNLFPVDPK